MPAVSNEVAGVGAEDYRFKAWFTQQTLVGNEPCYQVQKYLQMKNRTFII
ncbi:MAG: hypothetical protein ACLU30_12970 [Odoribacter splanchnicus]